MGVKCNFATSASPLQLSSTCDDQHATHCSTSLLFNRSSSGHPAWLVKGINYGCTSASSATVPCMASVTLGLAGRQPSTSQQRQPNDIQSELELLPVGTHRGRRTENAMFRYVWDGDRIRPLDETTLNQLATASGRLNHWFGSFVDNLWRSFFPDAKDVTPDYWEWLRWRLTQRFFSSTMQNLSTQSLLLALGMGAKKTIAASAAINWLLKDGVGRIARMTVATNFGQSFDSDLKRIRFTTSLIFETTIGCEFITPFFPQHFLLLASIANLGKAIALAAFVATAPAFQQALCAGGNLADLTAKNQAQHMVVDMLALSVSASAMYAAKNMKVPALLPLAAYPVLAVCDICTIYNELKAVQLRTLNRERAEMVASEWLRTGRSPPPGEVCSKERLLLPPREGRDLLPLDIVPLSQLLGKHPKRLKQLVKEYSDSLYLMDVKRSSTGVCADPGASAHLSNGSGGVSWPWSCPPKPQIQLSLSEEANGGDILVGILEAVYLRQAVHDKLCSMARTGGTSNGVDASLTQAAASDRPMSNGTQHIRNGAQRCNNVDSQPIISHTKKLPPLHLSRTLPLSSEEWELLERQAHKRAVRDSPAFIRDVKHSGWKIQPFQLSTNEKEGYVLLEGRQRRKASWLHLLHHPQ